MKIGTKTLLWGCHNVILHPLYTWAGWVKLYGAPPWRMLLAFLIHDWGYWRMPVIDGPEDGHPMWASSWVRSYLGWRWREISDEILYHSRFLAEWLQHEPSRLCWADKVGTYLMPSLLWAVLAHLSGEGYVYTANTKYEINQDHTYSHSIGGLYRFHREYRKWVKYDILKPRGVKP